jgi:hypothetical protein
MKKGLMMLVVISMIIGTWVVISHAQETPTMSGFVFLDGNGNGLFDESISNGIAGVQVIFMRDYDCNGVVDGSDEMFDYDFTDAAGYFLVVNAWYCYIGSLDPETVPEGMVYTTSPIVAIATGQESVTDVNFGLSYYQPYDTVCPKPANWWKKEFKKQVNFSKAELETIAEAALRMTGVFETYNEIFDALDKGDDENEKTDKARRQFAALALNLAAAEVHGQVGLQIGMEPTATLSLGSLTDAKTVGAAFDEIENYLLNNDIHKKAIKIAKKINKGEGLQLNCNE